jgi:hypothetical protein
MNQFVPLADDLYDEQTIQGYVAALGGALQVSVVFSEDTVVLNDPDLTLSGDGPEPDLQRAPTESEEPD